MCGKLEPLDNKSKGLLPERAAVDHGPGMAMASKAKNVSNFGVLLYCIFLFFLILLSIFLR